MVKVGAGGWRASGGAWQCSFFPCVALGGAKGGGVCPLQGHWALLSQGGTPYGLHLSLLGAAPRLPQKVCGAGVVGERARSSAAGDGGWQVAAIELPSRTVSVALGFFMPFGGPTPRGIMARAMNTQTGGYYQTSPTDGGEPSIHSPLERGGGRGPRHTRHPRSPGPGSLGRLATGCCCACCPHNDLRGPPSRYTCTRINVDICVSTEPLGDTPRQGSKGGGCLGATIRPSTGLGLTPALRGILRVVGMTFGGRNVTTWYGSRFEWACPPPVSNKCTRSQVSLPA